VTKFAPRTAPPTVDPAEFRKAKFTCTACGVYAHHGWVQLHYSSRGTHKAHIWRAECEHCEAETYWFDDGRQIDPLGNSGPPPNADMPDDVRHDYLEAGAVLDVSPRSACALLRLATETLVRELGGSDKGFNENIRRLREDGLQERVIKAMDVLRVVGNNAVHKLDLDLRDDHETATSLFELLNVIVEQCISQPRRINEMHERLPDGAKEAIAKRDASASASN
jgi:hypothetical protein